MDMATPNDYLRLLLIELAERDGLTDSAIQRAYIIEYGEAISITTILRFRHNVEDGLPFGPTAKIEMAYAAATGTTRAQNWDEAFRRWRAALTAEARKSMERRTKP